MEMNPQLEPEVRARLNRDQRVPHPTEIAILGDGRIVRLRGTVGSFRQLRAAVEDAEDVPGVDEVIDDLKVRALRTVIVVMTMNSVAPHSRC